MYGHRGQIRVVQPNKEIQGVTYLLRTNNENRGQIFTTVIPSLPLINIVFQTEMIILSSNDVILQGLYEEKII